MLINLKFKVLNKLIKKSGVEDYFFVLHPNSEYSTTNNIELHSLDSEKPLLVGFKSIFRGLVIDYYEKKFMY